MHNNIPLTPEFELKDPGVETIRYLDHGHPSPLIRWHAHDDFELHFIVATSGKVFVGDYVGTFAPGQLILTGPRLPHNWICRNDVTAVAVRDRALQFPEETFAKVADILPELGQLSPLLERARSGIEFVGVAFQDIQRHFDKIRDSSGLHRLLHFLDFMQELAQWNDYRLLSTVQMNNTASESQQQRINQVVEYINQHCDRSISLLEVAELVGMSESNFSRFFRKATGNRFIEFLNRVRISRACIMLSETNEQITQICYQAGFNNIANFNRRFQELKGVTPREYRQQAQLRFTSKVA
ncbi:AraC family transcriptional regulator [Pokkaliibacter sp. MBI-7]|uniref:AraC family transcriptional regulator n=1 Tax=Pokkaliibacter sp. MBI-7 TaxID=3040600 RepID=UPI00244C0CC3|nr:AraC family transcriptional regulator [Pokkaliibacter sp. MBI-7]MDH2431322.1 AraC family transcriptional regulator [Pokkaliibacter sp. MBI-7]